MTTLCVSEGSHWPQRFASVKWEGVFLEINTMSPQGPPRMQIQKCIQVPLMLIRNSIAKCPPKSATRAIFLENSFSVWNQKNLLKRFYWMPGAGRAKIFSTHLAPKLYQRLKAGLEHALLARRATHDVPIHRVAPGPEADSRRCAKTDVPFP